MKKYIYAILLVLFFIDCDSQQNVSNLLKEAARNRDTICFDNYYCCFMDTCWTITAKQDTVKILLLVCDTSLTSFTSTLDVNENGVVKSLYEIKNRVPHLWWQFGYVAYGDIFRQPIYLDQNKKPISKSIVVWITKEIK